MPLRLPARPLLYRRTLILLVHIALIPLAYLAAFGLRFDFQIPPQEFAHFQTTVWYLLGIRLIVFWAGGLYRGYWKHVGLRDLVDLGLAVSISSAAFGTALALLGLLRGMPRPLFLLDWVVMIFFSGGIRFRARALREKRLARARLGDGRAPGGLDRKSTRLNSSHVRISYAVFCLKKKKKESPDKPVNNCIAVLLG